jgi:succinoglycan biosynthesis transport protein ExoP
MSFGQFLSILRARKWLGLAVFVTIVSLAVGLSLILPKKYTAAASVVVDVKPDPIALIANPAEAMPSFMATQVDIMTSDRVALRVIRDLKLTENPQIQQQWRDAGDENGTIEQWLIDLLQRQLDVKPSRESNVIQVVYKSPDPRFAAGLANAFAQAYIATTLELRVDPAKQFTTFFNAQTKEARDALEKAQAKFSEFQREKGILATEERLDTENARLNDLSAQFVQIQALAAESSSRQMQAQGVSADRIQDVLTNPLIAGMKADLSRSEAHLQELNSKFGENHPQVIEAKASIAESKARIEAEIRRITGGVSVSNTINKQREILLRREIDEQRAQVARMKSAREKGQVLERDVESAQRTYEGMIARLNQVALQAQSTQSYAAILTTAQPPSNASFPNVILNTLLSVFAGTLLGLGAILGRELADRRIRASSDLSSGFGLSLIGTLPRPAAKRVRAVNRLSNMQQRVLGLLGPTKSA